MPNELSINTIRLALGIEDLRARVAASNIASLNRDGMQAMRLDDGPASFLAWIPEAGERVGLARSVEEEGNSVRDTPLQSAGTTTADREVADMAEASATYQTLTDVLGREFALLRLSISGRS